MVSINGESRGSPHIRVQPTKIFYILSQVDGLVRNEPVPSVQEIGSEGLRTGS